MKRQIRRGTFETNSSSTHAICITKSDIDKNTLPKHITFTHGEFGWEFDVHEDSWTKASYLYQAICDTSDGIEKQKKLDKIKNLLDAYGVSCEFASDQNKYDDGYIDHSNETDELIAELLGDGEKLVRYLFGDSFIVTGNDNGDAFDDYMRGENSDWNSPLLPKFNEYEIIEKGN